MPAAGQGQACQQPGVGAVVSEFLAVRLAEALAQGGPAADGFMNRLFDTLGWALTEFSVAVSDLCGDSGAAGG